MKKTMAAALVLILLISGCQNKEKPQPTDDGMLPAPEEQVINNELPGISLASAKLQITQTAPSSDRFGNCPAVDQRGNTGRLHDGRVRGSEKKPV